MALLSATSIDLSCFILSPPDLTEGKGVDVGALYLSLGAYLPLFWRRDKVWQGVWAGALCLSQVSTRFPRRTSTRPPHPLHTAPCPYAVILRGLDPPISLGDPDNPCP